VRRRAAAQRGGERVAEISHPHAHTMEPGAPGNNPVNHGGVDGKILEWAPGAPGTKSGRSGAAQGWITPWRMA
jgi:hypothetical protein